MMPGKSGKLCTDIILESILRSSTDTAIAATDLDFHILYYNPMAEKLFGYKAEEVIGKTVMEIHTKEKVEPYRFEKAIETVRKEGEYKYTVEQKKENGSRIIDSRVSGIWDGQKNLIGFVLMSRDITGHIKAEELLHIQRDLGIAIGNVSNLEEALTLVADTVTRLEIIDCCGIYLVDPQSGAFDLVHSKGLSQNFIKAVSHYDKNTESAHLIMKKQPVFMEYSKLKVSKTDIQYLEGLRAIAIIPVVHHGRVIACMNAASRTHKSISDSAQNALEAIASQVGTIIARLMAEEALQEKEHMLQSILRSAPIGVGLVCNRLLKWTNEKLCKMMGYSCKEMIDKSARMLYTCDEDYEYVGREKYAQIRERGTGTVETHWQRKDGKVIDVLLSSTPLDLDDLAAGVTFTALDITNRVNAERDQKRLNIELLQKNRELEQIVYVTSHDLRTPLVNIDGFSKELNYSVNELLSIIQSNCFNEDIKERIDSIAKNDVPEALKYISVSISKMDSLISGLLKLSRLGRSELNIEQLDMNRLISDVSSIFKHRIKSTGAELEISELPPCTGDGTQINQVFSNLIDNAVKFLDPDRPGIITISGYKDNEQSVYYIEDNGIGIAPEYQQKIFNIFHRLDPAKSKGDGLGLTIVHRVLERHNGKIWVESGPGKGSKFFVSLPEA